MYSSIKEELEINEGFNYWHNEVGITFDYFDIITYTKLL